jgi:hypothetical protein
MTTSNQESSIQGSAKVKVQHTRKTHTSPSREETGTGAAIVTQDTTAVQERILHTGKPEGS